MYEILRGAWQFVVLIAHLSWMDRIDPTIEVMGVNLTRNHDRGSHTVRKSYQDIMTNSKRCW
jgi:hypothetical protein